MSSDKDDLHATTLPSPIRASENTPGSGNGTVVAVIGDLPGLVDVARANYVFDKEIARGGMGRILRARDRRLGREVAVKELLDATPDIRARFEREARITARLQHPGIVHVYEAGVFGDGEPFYAMTLVSGESFDRVIARATDRAARLALLPNVLAVADALAYAHTHRVVHRDVKPHNVLVGEFGETVVIDWGLAKIWGDTADDPLDKGTIAGGGSETVAGAVIGTPAYMPLEQANGESVGPRADVYAVGAILYHTLAGAAPYVGKSASEILTKVVRGAPEPLADAAPGTPEDLVTIVTKAMARDPQDRYPTARELAEDLRRFQTGQLVGAHHYTATERLQRWWRRNRAVASASAIFIALLLGFGAYSFDRILRERDEAQRQETAAVKSRAEAVARRDAAESLTEFLVTDFRDKLAPIGKLDLLGSVGERVAAYYNALTPSVDLDATAQRRRAVAMLVVADVATLHGDLPGAERACREGLAAIAELLRGSPGNLDGRVTEVKLHVQLGHAHKTGQFALAEQDLTRAVTLARAVVADHPHQRNARRALGGALYTLADVMEERGRAAEVVPVYREAIALFGALTEEDRGDAEAARSHGLAMQRLGSLGMWHGELVEGERQLVAARARQEQTLAAAPSDVRIRRDLYITLFDLGSLQALKHDYDAMLVTRRAALEQAEWLYMREPESNRYQDDVILMLGRIGDALVEYGKLDEAMALQKRAAAMGEAQLARTPGYKRGKRLLANSLGGVADVHAARGEYDRALAARERAVALIIEAVGADPHEGEDCEKLAVALAMQGKDQLGRHEPSKALALFRRAIELQECARTAEPMKLDRGLTLQMMRRGEAAALLGIGDRDKAKAILASAIETLEPWLTFRPDHVELRGELALILADAARAASEPAAAQRLWRRIVDVLGPLEAGQMKPEYRAALVEARRH